MSGIEMDAEPSKLIKGLMATSARGNNIPEEEKPGAVEDKPKNGLELLREEMLKRGATKAQVESKKVAMALDILANTGTAYSDLAKAEEDYKLLDARRRSLKKEIDALEDRRSYEYIVLQLEQDKLADKTREAEEHFAEMKSYIEQFNAALESMETEEARDRLRTAQVFVNSIEVKTAYDNTAYINWFGAILAGDKVGGLESFKKINPDAVTAHKQMKARKIY